VCEVIVYNRELTPAEKAEVEYYLIRKWSVLNSTIPRHVYATKNGNWSDPTVWSVNTEPSSPWNRLLSSDNVYSNTFTVTADSSTRVSTIQNAALVPNIAAGGSFWLANGVSLSAGITSPVTNTTLISSQVTTQSSIIGPIINTANLPSGSLVFIHSGTGTLELSCGRFFYGTAATLGQILLNTNNGKVILKGDVITGTGSGNSIHYANLSGGNIDIIGNVLHSSNYNGGRLVNSSTGTLSITGVVVGSFGGNGGQGTAIYQSGIGITKILGTVYGANSPAIEVSNGKLELVGNLTSGTYPGTYSGGFAGITQLAAGTVSVTGVLIASNVGGGYFSATTSFTPLSVYGNIINAPNGCQAIYAPRYQVFPSASATYTRHAVNGYDSYVDYWASNATFSYPASSDVVLSTVYSNNTLSGSMALPSPSAVFLNCPVGSTTTTIFQITTGNRYLITSNPLNTNFTLVGASSNTPGTIFTATSVITLSTPITAYNSDTGRVTPLGTSTPPTVDSFWNKALSELTLPSNTAGGKLKNVVTTQQLSSIYTGLIYTAPGNF
jgi:hypothetical protein